jgi:hypothetical protein
MKKLIVALCFTSLLAVAAHAEDKPAAKPEKKTLTAEQKTARKALVEKYDANKDGKLDKEERSKATSEELEKAGYAAKKEKAAK